MNTSLSATESLGSPLYEQVKQAVLAALAQGEWKQGDAIPPEKLLAERFGVSIGTLRKAIDELAAENILVRHQGRGTYVAAHTRNHHFFKFFRILRQDGHKTIPSPSCCVSGACAPRPPRAKLELPAGAQVFEFVNLLSLNGDVVMTDEICLPESRFPGLTEAHLRERPSTLYALYQDVFGVNVIGTDERLRAGLADRAQARWLGVQEGEPLLEIRRVAYSYNRQPVEWRISRVNTAAYEYLGNQPWGRVPAAPAALGRRYGPAEPDPCGLDLGGRAAMRRVSSVGGQLAWGGSCARDENASVGWMRWRFAAMRAAASKPLASSARMLRHYLIRRRFA